MFVRFILELCLFRHEEEKKPTRKERESPLCFLLAAASDQPSVFNEPSLLTLPVGLLHNSHCIRLLASILGSL